MENTNNFTIRVATVNGSGSQSSNNILMRSLFYMGIPVAGKNIFPSNIAGLPTWFHIRVSKEGYVGMRKTSEIYILMNAETFAEDVATAPAGSAVIYHDILAKGDLRSDLHLYPVPFQKIVNECCEVTKLRRLVINMVYVGVAAQLFNIDMKMVRHALEKQFASKPKAVDLNWQAIEAGFNYAKDNLKKKDPYKSEPLNKTKGKIMLTGNEALAMGCLFGGCSVFSWYPITPASSVGESVIDYFGQYRRDPSNDNRAHFAVVQAEDELAALGMAIGAGWAGARSATSTSGPGISLMAEFAGLAYFTEIPTVIFDVQRLGPSTGLPTRTSQGDILFTHFLSHGDTKHLALIPSTMEECFEMSTEAFNLADEFQTPIFVMSDLDLGMNLWMSEPFEYPKENFRRGKVLTEEQLNKMQFFERYGDPDGDGVSYRTLPGNKHSKAAYFTRGSGHTFKATYSEKPEDWRAILDKIAKKIDLAKTKTPQPIVEEEKGAKVGLIAYGSTHFALEEAREHLKKKGLATGYLRIRALPLNGKLEKFIQSYDTVYCVEQNQQGQMAALIRLSYPLLSPKVHPILHYDGMPIYPATIVDQILADAQQAKAHRGEEKR
ncbi:MAG: 2-oxoacid:acceptor oxidoreductase subunit alpha [Deltaproteobacteria bacterium]|nr:2-oxoacid:acceptor oxidoreductase subunit alpha [Deltaproteobacteria bacterium]